MAWAHLACAGRHACKQQATPSGLYTGGMVALAAQRLPPTISHTLLSLFLPCYLLPFLPTALPTYAFLLPPLPLAAKNTLCLVYLHLRGKHAPPYKHLVYNIYPHPTPFGFGTGWLGHGGCGTGFGTDGFLALLPTYSTFPHLILPTPPPLACLREKTFSPLTFSCCPTAKRTGRLTSAGAATAWHEEGRKDERAKTALRA